MIWSKVKWEYCQAYDFFGLKFSINLDDQENRNLLPKVVPQFSSEVKNGPEFERFYLITSKGSVNKGLFWFNGKDLEPVYSFEHLDESSLIGLGTKMMFSLAHLGPPKMFFFHAGAVYFRRKAILIPGDSFSGKTTLISYLINKGAIYYTDDCAVIDAAGILRPNPTPLGIRSEEGRKFLTAREMNGVEGQDGVKINYILFTHFEKDGNWNPRQLSSGQSSFKLLESLFHKPAFRRFPAESLRVITNLAENAEAFESPRGEPEQIIKWLEMIEDRDV